MRSINDEVTMNTPCDRIADIEEIKRDVKELLAFKNKAMGIITGITIVGNLLAFVIGKIF